MSVVPHNGWHTPESIALVVAVFLLAGWVKGVVGMGLPTVAMGALGLVMAPVQAAALLVVPSLVTNVWQFATASKRVIARRLATMNDLRLPRHGARIQFLTSGSSRWPSVALGAVLAAYALVALFMPRFEVATGSEATPVPSRRRHHRHPLRRDRRLRGSRGPVPQCAAPRQDELVKPSAFLHRLHRRPCRRPRLERQLPDERLFGVLAAVVPALIGMFAGQRMRDRIEPVAFRKWFFVAMLAVGGYMVARA